MRQFEVEGSRGVTGVEVAVVPREGCYAAMCGRWDSRQHGFVHCAYVELARVEGDMSSILWLGNASVEGTGYDCVCLLKVDGLRSSIPYFIDPAVWLQRAVNSCYLLQHYFDFPFPGS